MTKQPQAKCPHCNSDHVWKRGAQILREGMVQRYQCKNCGYLFNGTQLIFKLPDPVAVRGEFLKIVENLDSFIRLTSTHESMKFREFHHRLHLIRMDILRVWHQVDMLTITDRKYSKAFERLRKILIKLVDLRDVEKKHIKNNILSWELEFQKGKLRKDLVKLLKDTLKQLKKTQKNI
jgi:transcription elongation factor Elf1